MFDLLYLDKARQRMRKLVLLLPPEKAVPGLAEKTARGLRRHAELRIEGERRALRKTYRHGWRVAGMALLLLAICIALSSFFASSATEGMRPHLRTTLEYSFEIVGWVILWHPIDVLVFNPLAIRARIAALQSLASVEVAVQVDAALSALTHL
jgi:hypothetical protein